MIYALISVYLHQYLYLTTGLKYNCFQHGTLCVFVANYTINKVIISIN